MAYKENFPPSLGAGAASGSVPPMLSPNKNPALILQRDHSACRSPDTPLKVRKTRENLRQSIYADVPPPCLHAQGSNVAHHCDTQSDFSRTDHQIEDSSQNRSSSLQYEISPQPSLARAERQKSTSRGMLSKVKQGIANKSKTAYSIRAAETGSNLIRRLSGRRKESHEIERRIQSYEAKRKSFESEFQPEHGSAQQSLTASSASTMDILGDYLMDETPFSSSSNGCLDADIGSGINFKRAEHTASPIPSSPSLQPTPRPLRRDMRSALPVMPSALAVRSPCVSLSVSMDCSTVDVSAKRDVWIAVEATVEESVVTLGWNDENSDTTPCLLSKEQHPEVQSSKMSYDHGRITSLRLCYKPTGDCVIREVIGQKSMKNVSLGQKCSLFIKVHVPELPARSGNGNGNYSDQHSLFEELESLVGTLEVDILHIEARYRLSVLPPDNVVAIRRVCHVRRPDSSSRWSTALDLTNQLEDPNSVYRCLAEHLAARYSPSQTMSLLQRYIDTGYMDAVDVLRLVGDRTAEVEHGQTHHQQEEHSKPSVVITESENTATPPHDSLFNDIDVANIFHSMDLDKLVSNSSSLASLDAPEPKVSAIVTPSTVRNTLSGTHLYKDSSFLTPFEARQETSEDPAHQLWRSIRRTSLSIQQMDALSSPEHVQQLEAENAGIRMLRRTAIANKRSVGAETLKGWKWDEEMEGENMRDRAEAPWL